MAALTGTAFEEYVWKGVWLRRFSPSQGWNSDPQKQLASRHRVDFTACRGNDRAVGDAKDKAVLTYADVDKLLVDGGVYRAQQLLLILASDTQVPRGVKEHADYYGVQLVRTQW